MYKLYGGHKFREKYSRWRLFNSATAYSNGLLSSFANVPIFYRRNLDLVSHNMNAFNFMQSTAGLGLEFGVFCYAKINWFGEFPLNSCTAYPNIY